MSRAYVLMEIPRKIFTGELCVRPSQQFKRWISDKPGLKGEDDPGFTWNIHKMTSIIDLHTK